TRFSRDWSSDVCSSDLEPLEPPPRLLVQSPGNLLGAHHLSLDEVLSRREGRRLRRPRHAPREPGGQGPLLLEDLPEASAGRRRVHPRDEPSLEADPMALARGIDQLEDTRRTRPV